MNPTLLDYYRFPPELLPPEIGAGHSPSGVPGFFRFGGENICYGQCQTGVAADLKGSEKFDGLKGVAREGGTIQLPFDFTEIIENLRRERYREKSLYGSKLHAESVTARAAYYFIRDHLPASFRRQLQKIYFRDWEKLRFPAWPVDFTVDNLHELYLLLLMEASGVDRVPFIWFWPDGAPSCLIVTHDVETSAGRDFTSQLMDLDESHNFKSSFQVIPEKRYAVPNEYVSEIRTRGFEFNVHDLNHDGRLYLEKREFVKRAARINAFIHRYESHGFRAGSMYRNQDWYGAFDFSYDMSVPNVASLDAMRGGCCTVMPYFIDSILELPVTTTQDYSLFRILNDYSTDLWKKQIELIRNKNGLISIITHPDYLIEKRARSVYVSLLEHLRRKVSDEKIWAALPRDVDEWWRARSKMKLERRGDEWQIVGFGGERARLAYAVRDGHQLRYEIAGVPSQESVLG